MVIATDGDPTSLELARENINLNCTQEVNVTCHAYVEKLYWFVNHIRLTF